MDVVLQNIKLLMMDCDGVLTDAGMYYSPNGDELKRFSTYDGMGINLLRRIGIKSAIITGENSPMVSQRAAKLKIEYLYLGCGNKLEAAIAICRKENLTLKEIAFIGDDINDLELLRNVGFAACPPNARPEVKEIENIYLLSVKGGDGTVREVADMILHAKGVKIGNLLQANIQ